MGIGLPNATISTSRTDVRANPNTTTQPLLNWPCGIGIPEPKDQERYGGRVKYLMVLDPGVDIQVGDTVFIQSWGKHVVDTTRGYNVLQADPSGFLDLELVRVPIASIGDR